MGNSIDKIADRFYISSCEPLGDKRRVDELGVTHILNGAEEHLYRQHGGRLEGITYKVMGWDDAVGQIILPQLREAADFIEQVANLPLALLAHSPSALHVTAICIFVHIFPGHCWWWHHRALRCRYISQLVLLPCIPHGQKAYVSQCSLQTCLGCARGCTSQPGLLEAASHARKTGR